MAKNRLTPFARLLLFLIILLPAAFFGAAYINGEDPMQKIRDFTGGGSGVTNEVAKPAAKAADQGTSELEKRILQLERDLAVAKEKLARCQAQDVE